MINNAKISQFTEQPNNYLLQVKTTKDGQKELGVIKKGLFSWLKIHLGSFLGLFDKSTLKLNEVAKCAMAQKDSLNEEFCNALDYKIAGWNIRHIKAQPIATIHPHFHTFQDPSVFHKWLDMTDSQVATEIIKKLPHGCCTNVMCTRQDPTSSSRSLAGMPPPQGKICWVVISPASFAQPLKIPNFGKIIAGLNDNKDRPTEEFKKISQPERLHLLFYKDVSGACCVKIERARVS